MPRIQEYLPEENAAGPQGAVSPNLEQVTTAGRGLEALGRQVSEAGGNIYRHQAQIETAEAIGDASDYKLAQLQYQLQGQADGTYDVDKHKQAMQQYADDHMTDYETPAAQATFSRAMTRAQGSLISRGIRIQAQVGVNNAVSNYNQEIQKQQTATELAPDTWADNMDHMTEYADTLNLPAGLKPQAIDEMKSAIAEGRIKGVMRSDPAAAQKLLADPKFAGMLTPKQLDNLTGLADHAQDYQDKEIARQETAAEKASKAKGELVMQQHWPDIESGKMSPGKVLMALPDDMPIKMKNDFAKQAEEANKLYTGADPAVVADTRRRLLLPPSDPQHLDPTLSSLIGVKGLDPKAIGSLNKWYVTTPQGAAEKSSEKMMMQDIQGKLKAPVVGMPDTDYHNLVNNAAADYQKAKANILAAHGDPSVLTDPKSKDYFPNTIQKRSMQDFMKMSTAAMSGNTQAAPAITASPGVVVPPQAVPASPATKGLPPIQVKNKDGSVTLYDATTRKKISQ